MRATAAQPQSETAAHLDPARGAARLWASWQLELEIGQSAHHPPLKLAGAVQVHIVFRHLRGKPQRTLQVVSSIPIARLFTQQVPVTLFGELDQRQQLQGTLCSGTQRLTHVEIAEV